LTAPAGRQPLTDFASRISAVGSDWSNVGENIATGYTSPATVVRALDGQPG